MLHIIRNTVVLRGPSEETLNKADEVGVVTRWVWSLLYCYRYIVNVVPTVYNNMNVTKQQHKQQHKHPIGRFTQAW